MMSAPSAVIGAAGAGGGGGAFEHTRLGLPLHDAMLAAFDAAAAEAESTLAVIDQIEDTRLALRLCVQIVRAFEAAEPSLAAISMRGVNKGIALNRKNRREAAAARAAPP